MKVEGIRLKLEKIFGKRGVIFVALGLLAGLALLIVPKASDESTAVTQAETADYSAQYCASLEQKAERLIKSLSGVKDCTVFITLEKGYRCVYATDQHVREESGYKETDKTIVLADNGNGETAILIEEAMPTVAGVAIVCRGASYETQYRIIELVCALFDIESNRISVQT